MKKLLLFGLFALCFSCKQKDAKNNTATLSTVTSFSFQPKTNANYTYETVNETIIEQTVDKQEVASSNKLETQASYRVQKDSMSHYVFTITYQRFILSFKVQDNETVLDAAKAGSAFSPTEKMFSAFNNAILVVTTDSTGHFMSLSGYKELLEKMRSLAGNDPNAIAMLNGSIRQYVNEQFFAQGVQQNFNAFAGKAVKQGEEWTQTNTTNVGVETNLTTRFKITDIDKHKVTIASNGKLDLNEQEIKVQQSVMRASITAEQKGNTEVDAATGVLLQSNTNLTAKGVVVYMGRDVPLKVITKSTIKLL